MSEVFEIGSFRVSKECYRYISKFFDRQQAKIAEQAERIEELEGVGRNTKDRQYYRCNQCSFVTEPRHEQPRRCPICSNIDFYI